MLRVLDDINDRVRIRRKIKGYFNKSLYKEFLKKNPEYKKVIDYDTFLKISDISNLKLKDALFENTDGV
jgi:integrase